VIAGLAEWLQGRDAGGAEALAAALEPLLGAVAPRLAAGETLWRSRVHRLHFGASGAPSRAFVVKRLPLDRSQREQRAVRRWLPAIGLSGHGPPLVALAPTPDGSGVWHVYEDLGDGTLAQHVREAGDTLRPRIRAAVALAAGVHVRFAAHPLLAEGRLHGIDLGASFFGDTVGDAARAVAALRRRSALPPEERPLLDRLLGRLRGLAASAPARARDHALLAWPETLLHGDLWLTNFLWERNAPAEAVRLIDWDHAGVGAALYDLSTLLRQFPVAERTWILDAYREAITAAGWPWPAPDVLERTAEACELGRFASTLLWRTLFALEQPAEPPAWLWEELREVERWFVERGPLLPARGTASAA
jgi:hypothetical protein